MTRDLTAARQEVNNSDSSVVVQGLELAMNLALFGLLCSLGNQYIVGSLSWRSLTFTDKSSEWLLTTVFSSVEVSL